MYEDDKSERRIGEAHTQPKAGERTGEEEPRVKEQVVVWVVLGWGSVENLGTMDLVRTRVFGFPRTEHPQNACSSRGLGDARCWWVRLLGRAFRL